ncbi:hypothetical protein D3C71_1248470 [compost metagenome]
MRRFSSTVSRAKISRPCGTKPMPALALSYGVALWIGLPSSSMLPLLMGTRPMSDFSSVVLPTPLRPSRTVTLPSVASKLTSLRMWEPP